MRDSYALLARTAEIPSQPVAFVPVFVGARHTQGPCRTRIDLDVDFPSLELFPQALDDQGLNLRDGGACRRRDLKGQVSRGALGDK